MTIVRESKALHTDTADDFSDRGCVQSGGMRANTGLAVILVRGSICCEAILQYTLVRTQSSQHEEEKQEAECDEAAENDAVSPPLGPNLLNDAVYAGHLSSR